MREVIKDSVEEINNQSVEVNESSSSIEEIGASLHNVENTLISKLIIIDNLVKITKAGENRMNYNNDV